MTQAPARALAKPIPTVRDVVLRASLALAILLPVIVLFGQLWIAKSATAASVDKERVGIDYLHAIAPVITSLTAAESVAVSGDAVDFGSIDGAVLTLGKVDDSDGATLDTHVRFSSLSTKIQQLHTRSIRGPQDAFNAYSEVTALVLALAEEVRHNSGLIHDQSADVYYLEDGAARQLPASVVYAGQYGDLVTIAINESAAQRQATIGAIASARASILNYASQLGDDVRLAVSTTPSQTLSGDLLAKLDRFRLAIDSLVPPASMPNELPSTADRGEALSDKAKVQQSATDLSAAMLDATAGLLITRADDVRQGQELAILTFVFVMIVAATPVTFSALTRRRRRAAFDGPRSGAGQSNPPAPPSSSQSGADRPAVTSHAAGDSSSRAWELSSAAR